MLRATTLDIIMSSKAWGLVAMGGAIVILFVIPWLDRHPVRSIRYRGWLSKLFMAIFVVDFLILGYLGTQPATPGKTMLAQFGTVYYFSYFLLIMPFVHKFEKSKPVPERVTGGH
ncbi:hypothetical protein A3717_19430 [Alcanivorax sp. HI0013]|nr:hypothetical protein A3717_19430 [Alcanivorax sp. HI0013]